MSFIFDQVYDICHKIVVLNPDALREEIARLEGIKNITPAEVKILRCSKILAFTRDEIAPNMPTMTELIEGVRSAVTDLFGIPKP